MNFSKKFFLTTLLTFSALLTTLLFSYQLVLSQEEPADEKGVSISPITFELNSDPGDTLSNQVKIYNPTEFPQTVKMKVEDFTPVGEEGQVVLEEPDGDSSTFSLASWTEIYPTELTLQPSEQQIVTFVINVPTNGEPGGHYGSIVALISGAQGEGTGTSISSKRGALLLLKVSGKITEELMIKEFSTKGFQETGPVDLTVRFENSGNVHVRPAGFVAITDLFGNKVAELEIPQNNVIPGSVRQANVTWEEERPIGYYTATLAANYGATSKQTISATTTFIVFPWKIGLVVLVILVIIIFILLKSRKRIKRATKVLVGKD